MSASSDAPERHDPLEPVLREVEDELRQRLRDACEAEADGRTSGTSGEIRELEDTLLAAAVAAEQTLKLRRQIERRKETGGNALEPGTGSPRAENGPAAGEPDPSQRTSRVREFKDASGALWRAWPVTPGQARPGRTTERYLGEYHKGWICFEAMEGSARRRLPEQHPRWSDLDDTELAGLLDQAISAPNRKLRTRDPRV